MPHRSLHKPQKATNANNTTQSVCWSHDLARFPLLVKIKILSVGAHERSAGVSCLLLARPPLDGKENMPKKTPKTFFLHTGYSLPHSFSRLSSFQLAPHFIDHCLEYRLRRSEKPRPLYLCLVSLPAGSRRHQSSHQTVHKLSTSQPLASRHMTQSEPEVVVRHFDAKVM